MPQVITARVEKSTKSKDKENSFCTKLVAPGAIVETAFGPVQGSNRTFYMFTTTQATVGAEGQLDLDLFDIVPKTDYEYVDQEGKTITTVLNHLYPKRA